MARSATPPPPTIAERHGHLVRAARESLAISQQTLADSADTTQQTISRVEKGKQVASDELRVRIAGALGMSAHDIFPYFENDEEEQ